MAISTLTLPVPAPTSQQTSDGITASLARITARTSCLLMGTWPRMNASSGRPGARRAGTGGGSTSTTFRGEKVRSARSETVPTVMVSSG